MKPITALSLVAAAAALASCQSERGLPRDISTPPQHQRPQPAGVDGAWVDPNGIVSTFSGGTFATRTTDSNQLLASGTYISVGPSLVEINMTSLVRNTTSKVNCALVGRNQLNCTTAQGAQFSLSRRA